jgi:hypothetical protein
LMWYLAGNRPHYYSMVSTVISSLCGKLWKLKVETSI